MNARESQDRMFSSSAAIKPEEAKQAQAQAQAQAQNQLIQVNSTPIPKKDNSQIIDIILAGDFE